MLAIAWALIQAAPPWIEEARFGAPDPAWTERVERLRFPKHVRESPPAKEGFVVLRVDGLIPDPSGPWREQAWFDGRRMARTRLFDPAGRLRRGIDWVGDDVVALDFHPDGSTAALARTRGMRWVEGYSRAADGSALRGLVAGKGELLLPGLRDGESRHLWFHGGHAYLAWERLGGRSRRVSLMHSGDVLDLHPDGEALRLQGESWEWGPWEGARYQPVWFTTPEGTLARVISTQEPKVRDIPMYGSHAGLQEEWDAAYPVRRARFLKGYLELLQKVGSGGSTRGLELARLRHPWID